MGAGTYGEGQVGDVLAQLNDLKSQVQSGKLNLTDFQTQAEPLTKRAQSLVEAIAGQGSKAASAVNPIWQQLQSQGFVGNQAGKWVSQLPFSKQEYARLPDSVLPTQKDIDKGIFDPTQAPSNRLQPIATPPSDPNVPAVAPATPGVTDPNANKSTKDILDIVGGVNPGVDARSDQGQLQTQGDQNAKQLAETLSLQQQLRGDALTKAGTEYSTQNQERQQSLKDLSSLLAQNQMDQFNRAVPDLAEQANTSGILRSTGFGDSLARKYGELQKDTTTQLALQGLNDRNMLLGQKAGLTQAGIGNADTYASGLTDVVNTKIGADNAGLQRNFSLADYQKQLNDAVQYGQAPATPSSKTAGGAGALLGAGVGGYLGGPMGASAGASAGGMAGSGVKK